MTVTTVVPGLMRTGSHRNALFAFGWLTTLGRRAARQLNQAAGGSS